MGGNVQVPRSRRQIHHTRSNFFFLPRPIDDPQLAGLPRSRPSSRKLRRRAQRVRPGRERRLLLGPNHPHLRAMSRIPQLQKNGRASLRQTTGRTSKATHPHTQTSLPPTRIKALLLLLGQRPPPHRAWHMGRGLPRPQLQLPLARRHPRPYPRPQAPNPRSSPVRLGLRASPPHLLFRHGSGALPQPPRTHHAHPRRLPLPIRNSPPPIPSCARLSQRRHSQDKTLAPIHPLRSHHHAQRRSQPRPHPRQRSVRRRDHHRRLRLDRPHRRDRPVLPRKGLHRALERPRRTQTLRDRQIFQHLGPLHRRRRRANPRAPNRTPPTPASREHGPHRNRSLPNPPSQPLP